MAALQATGFDGLLSLEIFSDRFRAGAARRGAIDGQRSLRFMLDELQQTTGVKVPGAPQLPSRSQVEDLEFLEFTVDQASAAALENVLRGLGFARAGVHRSKAVTRWRQGGNQYRH
jgi:4-hydroxyphenylpyruvate dioxygenase